MTKLIVEMEMADACPCDLIGVGYEMWCSAASGIPKRVAEYDECVKNGTRPDWCPIKGVLPETHGDLIDRDALKKNISVLQDTSIIPWAKAREYAEITKSSTLNIIDDQKAVIAAERKDDEQI